MGDGSTIEWTDATWNPVRGCSRVSEGCRNCYAEGVARRFSGPGQPYEGLVRLDAEGRAKAQWNGSTRFVPEHLADPLRWKRPRRIFVNSMSDLFHESLTDDAIDAVLAVMMLAHHHVFQVLTKRPERMRRYLSDASLYSRVLRAANALRGDRPELTMVGISDPARGLPRWIWLGVSVEDQKTADERIPVLLDTPAALRWVSYEPALGPVDFQEIRDGSWFDREGADRYDALLGRSWWSNGDVGVGGGPCLDWIVVGGESGPGARPFDLAWARSTIAQCREAGTKVFCKQLGARPMLHIEPSGAPDDGGDLVPLTLRDRKGGDMAEWPADLRVREMPDAR